MDSETLTKGFAEVFGSGAPELFFAPGRVNLIGEHIDYNGGRVLPCAISLGIYAAAGKNGCGCFRLYSESFPDVGVVNLPADGIRKTDCWADYPLGVLRELVLMFGGLEGMDFYFAGNLPEGAGLSSSAALCVLTCVAARDVLGLELEDVAGLCRRAENSFLGVSTGIMDQFAVYYGRQDHALCLDTDTMDYNYVPLNLGESSIVICDSKVKHELKNSAYNERRRECEAALDALKVISGAKSLCQLSPDEFEALAHRIEDDTALRRARHAVYENARVLEAERMLRLGDLKGLGELMNLSHDSLRDDYQVSCPELDTLVDAARSVPGVLGSRMTGAGFGGCTVSLVENSALDEFSRVVTAEFENTYSRKPDIFAAGTSRGAGRMENPCVEDYVESLLLYAEEKGLAHSADRTYLRNRLYDALGVTEPSQRTPVGGAALPEILDALLKFAGDKALRGRTSAGKDLLDTRLMGLLTPLPSTVIERFWQEYRLSPQSATDYLYRLSKDCNYIRTGRLKRDVSWATPTRYGDIEVTINLSKPEKDPRDIARAAQAAPTLYPKCALCMENEGFAGSVNQAARQNLRLIPIEITGGEWYFQYSPYSYYNEHCIVLEGVHRPMRTDRSTIERLFDFVDMFPHYFLGANADIPIVGGSILSHDHYQGGRHVFPMMRAEAAKRYTVSGFEDVDISSLSWFLTTLRLTGKDRYRLAGLAERIMAVWEGYSCSEAGILASTDGARHNAVNPILHREGEKYVLHICLRNNRTTPERPFGLFHPREEYHHIKKENIGLIEAMGLAILPARLKGELEALRRCILEGKDPAKDENAAKHAAWCAELLPRHPGINAENIDSIIRDEVGLRFAAAVSDCAVFAGDETGQQHLNSFMASV